MTNTEHPTARGAVEALGIDADASLYFGLASSLRQLLPIVLREIGSEAVAGQDLDLLIERHADLKRSAEILDEIGSALDD